MTPTLRNARRNVRRLALAVTAVLALAACGPTGPTPAPTGSPRPASEVYAEIRAAVEGIRGLAPTTDVEPVAIDEAQLRRNLEAEFDASNTPAEVASTEDLLITLGLLPPGSSLRSIILDFQSGQVAGYYSPERNQLFVVSRSGSVGAMERTTYAHEFTHQLQDQHVDLDALGTDATDQSDRALARLALVEGDAVSVQGAWMQTALTPSELGELLAAALGPGSIEALQRAPAYLRDTSLFPYNDGAAFVNRLLAEGGYAAVDAAYADPPDSTEQVLHPDRYLRREPPIEVAIPAGVAAAVGAGWSEAGRDTLGELILRIWLRQGGVSAGEARTAAAGWGGDRLVLLRGPDGATAVGLRTAWDTSTDALEFATAAKSAVAGLELEGTVIHAPGSSEVIVAVGERAVDVAAALGSTGG